MSSIFTPSTLKKLPDEPGVYLMRDKTDNILYIGKATSLKKRVSSYFQRPHEARIQQMVSLVHHIEVRQTRSALEALLLEAELIKKHLPPTNVMEKDDKTFAMIAITDEAIPRVIVTRPTKRENAKLKYLFGPYTSAYTARTALKIIRRIFPFHDDAIKTPRNQTGRRVCFDASIGLCPGVCGGRQPMADYRKNLTRIRLFLTGQRERVAKSLQRAMKDASKHERYELAAQIRNQLFALEHIQDVALINRENWQDENSDSQLTAAGRMKSSEYHIPQRIEAYDISHMSGQDSVGSMVVFTRGKIDKDQYRKFRLHYKGINDPAMIKEVLERRLNHPEWAFPNLFLIDGGRAQLYVAQQVVRAQGLTIPVAALAKGPTRKKTDIYCSDAAVKLIPLSLLIQLRDESHRFAIKYHRLLKRKGLLASAQDD